MAADTTIFHAQCSAAKLTLMVGSAPLQWRIFALVDTPMSATEWRAPSHESRIMYLTYIYYISTVTLWPTLREPACLVSTIVFQREGGSPGLADWEGRNVGFIGI